MSQTQADILAQGTKVQTTNHGNPTEDALIAAIDEKYALKRYQKDIQSLEKGSIDTPTFLKQVSNQMLKKLLYTIETTKDDRLKVNIAQDILDRAGHGKVNKAMVAHSHVDMNTTKTELINMVMSMGKKAGLPVKDVSHTEGSSDEEIDR